MSLLLHPQGKSPRYPLERRLGGPESHSGCRINDELVPEVYNLMQSDRKLTV